MATHLLDALRTIIQHNHFQLSSKNKGANRANHMGTALEEFIQDSFAHSFRQGKAARMLSLNKVFSYLGNQNNPPDMILHAGDAIEVKKIQSASSSLALNSSHPKDILHRDDHRLTKECRNLDDWQGDYRDFLYIIGIVDNEQLKHLSFIYGDCYAASREHYQRIYDSIISGIHSLSPTVELAKTKELGRVNRVDPLGITSLRIRGMWHIASPLKVFDYIYQPDLQKKFSFSCILRKSKYLSFPKDARDSLKGLPVHHQDVAIQNPNNPSEVLEAIHLRYEVEL